MWRYIIKRILYAIPVLIGVNLITFSLFFIVNTPDDMARMHLGQKYVKQAAVDRWKRKHGYDKPIFFNQDANGISKFTDTLFVDQTIKLFTFNFGVSDGGRNISHDITVRMWPSLFVAVPTLLFGLVLNISFAFLLVFFRHQTLDLTGSILCIMMMSISSLFYIIGGQYLFGKLMFLVPISGYSDGWLVAKFIALPIIVSIIAAMGAGARWYRTIFLEEVGKDYVRTARAKGLGEFRVLFRHVLRNGLIPILTGVVVILPTLFMGSLILESFFAIPGLGSYTIDAIQSQDFAIVRAMVFLGAVLYIVGLIMTDIAYIMADPRVQLDGTH